MSCFSYTVQCILWHSHLDPAVQITPPSRDVFVAVPLPTPAAPPAILGAVRRMLSEPPVAVTEAVKKNEDLPSGFNDCKQIN